MKHNSPIPERLSSFPFNHIVTPFLEKKAWILMEWMKNGARIGIMDFVLLCSPSMVFILREGYRCIGLTHFHLTRGWIEEHDGRCDDRRGSKKGKDGSRVILMDYSWMGSPHTRGGKVCKGFETSGSRWNEQRFWDRQSVLGKKLIFQGDVWIFNSAYCIETTDIDYSWIILCISW